MSSIQSMFTNLGCLTSTDLVPTLSQRAMLPLHHRHHSLDRLEEFESPTFWFVAKRSIQMSYRRIIWWVARDSNPVCP